MAIPSIGGNGNFKKNISEKISENSVPQEYIPEGAEDNFAVKRSSDKPQERPVQPKPQSKQEKEYSLEQFKKDYEEILSTKVIPQINKYEAGRILRLNLLLIFTAITVSVSFAAAYYLYAGDFSKSMEDGMLYSLLSAVALIAAGISFPVWVWWLVKKNYESKIKQKFMPVLMRSIPNFFWQQTPPVKSSEIQKCMIFPDSSAVDFSLDQRDIYSLNLVQRAEQTVSNMLPNSVKFEFDDCFVGTYRKVPVAVSECKYRLRVVAKKYNGKTYLHDSRIFQGAVVKIKMNKRFNGMTIIRPRYCDRYIEDGKDLDLAGLNKVLLEDVEFEKNFYSYSSDQIEARYLITTAFMERFKSLQKAFNTQKIYCSFFDDNIYIAPCTRRDLFALGSLVKPLYDKKQFMELYNQFSAILTLVDYFKLDKKLGL